MELQEYGSVEQMLHKAILIEQQVKRKSYSKPTYAPKPNYPDKSKSPTTTNNAFKTNVPAHVDKGKALETNNRARDIQCFRCQGLGHYASKCPNQKVMILLENGEVDSKEDTEDKEDVSPIFDEQDDSFNYPHQGSLLFAKRLMDEDFGPIFDEEDEHLDTDLGPIFDETLYPIFDEEDDASNTQIMVHFLSLGEH